MPVEFGEFCRDGGSGRFSDALRAGPVCAKHGEELPQRSSCSMSDTPTLCGAPAVWQMPVKEAVDDILIDQREAITSFARKPKGKMGNAAAVADDSSFSITSFFQIVNVIVCSDTER
jgi:hypothetical protein